MSMPKKGVDTGWPRAIALQGMPRQDESWARFLATFVFFVFIR